MEGMRERFLDCGFQDFIAKPLDRKELNQLLLRWVSEEKRTTRDRGEERTSLDPDAFQIEGVDLNAAMRFFSGDEKAFKDLLELYYLDGKRKIDLLRELAGSDIPHYQVEVHGLKSASANIGAMDVSGMAREQEDAAARGDTEYISQQLPYLLEEYDKLLINIGKFLDHSRQSDSHDEKLPPLSLEEVKEQVGTALGQLEKFRSKECAGTVEAILLHSIPKDVEESLTQIQEQLKLFEDDYVEELLRQLLNRLERGQ